MGETNLEGKVTFINHEKKYVIIEYMQGSKKKTATAQIEEKKSPATNEKKQKQKSHHYLVGDVVNFSLKLTPRGDRMIATDVKFRYNNALDVLVNKASTLNKFIGYLKEVDGKYFVKEIDSYLFFPVPFSPWQLPPTEKELNEQVYFTLQNLDKKEKITAELLSNEYIAEFHVAVKHYKNKTPLEATVSRITEHGIYLDVIKDKIKAKLPLDKSAPPDLVPGSKIKVIITHLNKSRIVVEPVK